MLNLKLRWPLSCLLLAMLAWPCLIVVGGDAKLRVAYEWKEIDYQYRSSEERWTAIERFEFKPNHVIPFGIEAYRSRLFVTLPRWRDGVPASLAYIDLNDTNKSPALKPYPSWQAHSLNEQEPELVSPFRIRADRCGRLWVLDSRISGVLEQTKIYGSPQLLVYDLHNDDLLRRHVFPMDQMKQSSFFANLAVEDGDCDHTFAYAADLGKPGLVVYSWQDQESWRVQHNFFHPDPLSGNFSVDDIEFQWDDGLYGLALSRMQPDGFATLYFHPLTSTMEFSVSTSILRNKTLATSSEIYGDFKVLGSRGANAQAGASFLDSQTGVLFYTLPNLNALGCWQTANTAAATYDLKSQGRVYTSETELIFPSDVKVDDQQRLWVISNRLPDFIYHELFPGSVNFRILTAPVRTAIEHTVCEDKSKPLPELINKLGDIISTTTKKVTANTSNASSVHCSTLAAVLLSGLVLRWL